MFVKKILEKTCRVMETLFQLLPFSSYVEILAGLMQKSQIVLRRKAYELLAKLLQEKEKLDSEQVLNCLTIKVFIYKQMTLKISIHTI